MKMRFEHVILLDEIGLDPNNYNVTCSNLIFILSPHKNLFESK